MRRNFLINPYGYASISYADTKVFNRNEGTNEEVVRLTRDGRFLITANQNGTISVFPINLTPCYRISFETRHAIVAHVVVRGDIVQVPPNYEIGPDGIQMKMLSNAWPEPFSCPSGVPVVTIMLYDEADARRVDFRNGNGPQDHWVTMITLTTKSPGHRRPKYDRICRVGYNGNYFTEILWRFAQSNNPEFGLGFAPTPRVPRDVVEERVTSRVEEPPRNVEINVPNPEGEPGASNTAIGSPNPNYDSEKSENKAKEKDAESYVEPWSTDSDADPDEIEEHIMRSFRKKVVFQPPWQQIGKSEPKVGLRLAEIPTLVTSRQTQTPIDRLQEESAEVKETRQDQRQAPIHTFKQLEMPTNEGKVSESRRTSITPQASIATGVDEGSTAGEKSDEKKKKKKPKSKDVAIDMVRAITEALQGMTQKYQDDSSDEDANQNEK